MDLTEDEEQEFMAAEQEVYNEHTKQRVAISSEEDNYTLTFPEEYHNDDVWNNAIK